MGLTENETADLMTVPSTPNPAWDIQIKKYDDYNRYFYGDVFSEVVNRGTAEEPSEPALLYPLRINLVRMMCFTHLQMFLGQWEDQVFALTPKQSKRGERLDQWAQDTIEFLETVWDESNFNSRIVDAALSMIIYGGAVFKVAFDPTLSTRIRIDHILPEYFFPRWHPMDPDKLLEATISFRMSVEDAKLAYGYEPTGNESETVMYVESWTKDRVDVSIAGEPMEKYCGANPYGFIPFVYIPRIRAPGDFYGLAVPEDILGLSNELNVRLADIGDRIQYSAHPQWVVSNYAGTTKTWEIGKDSIINLGTGLAGLAPTLTSLPPVAEPASSFRYIDFILDLSRMAAMSPPVAFGTDEGSQRSALTLSFRMWPLVQQSRLARLNWTTGIASLHKMVIEIRINRDKGRTDDKIPTSWLKARIVPKWSPILPPDRSQVVDEVMNAWNLGADPLVSPEAAVKKLALTDDSETELANVLALWKERRAQEEKVAKQNMAQQKAQAGAQASKGSQPTTKAKKE